MNRSQQRQILAALVIVYSVISFCESRLFAATYNFDVTDQIESPFGGSLVESSIDLGVTFSHIDSASIGLSGIFTPGLKTLVTTPPNSALPVSHDQLILALLLGNENTSPIDKPTFASQDLQGLSGQIDLVLPLMAAESSSPVLLPSGGGVPDFGFMLDGKFGLSTLAADFLVLIYQELARPVFSTSKISLIVEGTTVPEPSTLSFVAAILASAVLRRRTTWHKRD